MYCVNCGSKIADDSKFCTKCGAKIAGGETLIQANNQPVTRGENKKCFSVKKYWILLFCVVLVLVGAAVKIINGDENATVKAERNEAKVGVKTNKKNGEEDQWIEKGEKLYKQHDYDGASRAFQKAIAINPDNVEAWNSLGIVFNDVRNRNKAIECFKKAIAIDANYSKAWVNLGSIYHTLNNTAKSIECYQKAIAIDDKDAIIWNNLGLVYYSDLKDYAKAIECYQKTVNINPYDDFYWVQLGKAYYYGKNLPQALKTFRKALEVRTGNEEAINWCERIEKELKTLRN